MMKRKTDFTIRFGKIAFKIWHYADGRFAFDYDDGSRRKIVARKKLTDLRAAAHRIAIKIQNGETDALALTPQNCREFIAARDALKSIGLSIDTAAREFAAAKAVTPHLREAALFYRRNLNGEIKSATISQVVDELLKSKRLRGVSEEFYLRQLRQDLEHFTASFPDRTLAAIDAAELVDYIGSFKVAWRRQNKLRAALVILFRFGRKHGYLSRDRETEAEKIERADPVYSRPAIFRPAELCIILQHIREEWLPWAVIQSFTGARTEEIKRLTWADVHWEKKLVHISTGNSKTGRRTGKDGWLPIPDCLIDWLAPWRGAVGPICKLSRQERETERLKKLTGLPWKQDILRHSFGTYYNELNGIDETIRIMRHDRQTCERHYLNRRDITPEDAAAWFSTLRFNRAGNVIQTSFSLRFA